MRKFNIQAARFALVGMANFGLTFIVFTVMLKVLRANYLLSLLAAWVVGMLFSYILNFAWVFKPEKRIEFRVRFLKFALAGMLSIALNMAVLNWLVRLTAFDPFWIQVALVPFIVIFNFATAKYWSLRPAAEGKCAGVSSWNS
jgi:putative flippase GtrA